MFAAMGLVATVVDTTFTIGTGSVSDWWLRTLRVAWRVGAQGAGRNSEGDERSDEDDRAAAQNTMVMASVITPRAKVFCSPRQVGDGSRPTDERLVDFGPRFAS